MATKKPQLLTEPLVKVKPTTTPAPKRKKPIARIETLPPEPTPPTLGERLNTLLREPVLGAAIVASVVSTVLTLVLQAL